MSIFSGYSDLTKALLALSLACSALIVMILGWCTFWIYTCPQAEKFVMPGSHKVNLSRDTYMLWVYPVWKSKNINSALTTTPTIEIVDSMGNEITQETEFAADFTRFYSDSISSERTGSVQSFLELKNGGEYTVRSTDSNYRFVVALVPGESHYMSFGSNQRFEGDDNDLRFHDDQELPATLVPMLFAIGYALLMLTSTRFRRSKPALY